MISVCKYRLYPNEEQKKRLAQAFGSCRFIYNQALAYRMNLYATQKKSISKFNLINAVIPPLKEEHEWLNDPPSQALQQAVLHLNTAYKKFFKHECKFPTFKKKFDDQSMSLPQGVKVDFGTNKVFVPKLGLVKAKLHRVVFGEIKTCTVSKTKSDEYYISIQFEIDSKIPEKTYQEGDKVIGLDLGIKHFYTDSNGNKVENPRFYNQVKKYIDFLEKELSRKSIGSNNLKKIKQKIAKTYRNICNKRDDFLNKLSHKVINENQVIITEKLAVQDMMQTANTSLARNIGDVSWSKFITMLKYKADLYGKIFKQIDRYEPTSKRCYDCKHINSDLQLEDREWTCPACRAVHDRDFNAAKNILESGWSSPTHITLTYYIV